MIRAVVSIVAAAAGYLGVQYLLGPNLSLPDTVAGAHRLTDTTSQRFERDTADQGDRYGIDAEGGVYGTALGPEFFVILVDAAAVETTDELFDALVTGFSKAGAVVDEAGAKVEHGVAAITDAWPPRRARRSPPRACGAMKATSGSSSSSRAISG